MIDEKLLEELRGREVVLLVADKDEISASEVPFPVVYTGMGKMRMYDALVRWYAVRTERDPVILNIGSAGSARYPIGELLSCSCFVNGGSELIYDRINLPGKEGCSIFTGDYFMSTQTFSEEQVRALSQQYDLFDMEAYAAALFCRTHGIPFYCFKGVSDNLDGSLKDWRGILGDIRRRFTALLARYRE